MEGYHKRTRSESKPQCTAKQQPSKKHKHGEHTTKSRPQNEPTAVICDSGGYSIKIGDTTHDKPFCIPNSIMKAKSERKRLFIGNQIEDCRDLSGLYYQIPCEKGYITKWEVQKPIWDYVFQNYPLTTKPLIMTQPIFNFRSIQECMDEIFFEEYEAKAMIRVSPTDLAKHQYIQEKGYDIPCLIIDSGYSFTHIVPYIGGKKFYPAIKRIYVGGKLLTNYLKDILSYRQLHVMEETYVINQVKEDTCFVSQCLKDDMKNAKRPDEQNDILRNYILPDFNNIRRGYVQEPGEKEFPENCQILRLNNERFTVPELLIHPSNIGIQSMGIPEAVAKCVEACPEEFRQALMENILLIGGNATFPGYKNRLFTDIRSLTPCHLELNIHQPINPISYAWTGGKTLARSPNFQSMLISKQEYEEYGSNLTYKEFSDWESAEIPEPKIEIKPKKKSILDNLRGIDIFGKGGEEPEEIVVQVQGEPSTSQRKFAEVVEVPSAEQSPQKVQLIEETVHPLQSVAPKPVEITPKPVEIKNNYIPITTIRLPQLGTNLKPNIISTVRFIPISDVINGRTIVSNVKLG